MILNEFLALISCGLFLTNLPLWSLILQPAQLMSFHSLVTSL